MRAFTIVLAACLCGGAALTGVPSIEAEATAVTDKHLAKRVGAWDAVFKFFQGPGEVAMTAKGTEQNSLVAGGNWLISDLRADMGGMPFHGHGVYGYDPAKKKYVGTWVDSTAPFMMIQTGGGDDEGKVLTMWSERPGQDGGMHKVKMVTKFVNDDKRVFSMYLPGPSGKIDYLSMEITYTRKK